MLCYHCGDECPDDAISINQKVFCCNGCKTVFEMLEGKNLCDYYSIDKNPGISRKYTTKRNHDFLNDPDLKQKLIDFSNGISTKITFDIPQMHCSSCIWILENLFKLKDGITGSKVNFLQKKLFVTFLEEKTSLKSIVELLDSIGYEPYLNLEEKEESAAKSSYKNLYYKIGIAGFCFGNIMLLSFPEYLSIDIAEHTELKRIFAYLNLILSLPAFFYSANDYYKSSWKGLRKKIVNIDVPIALGLIVLFVRSMVDIVFLNGAGFLDSLTGLILFLLAGKLFQNKTYETLNFERNYKSYFPIAITTIKNGEETTIPVSKLEVGTRIVTRNNELIPADSILIRGIANVDYSFVTGESAPIECKNGEMIYAGGKQIGGAIELETVKEVSQSYLTQLWNNSAFKKNRDGIAGSFIREDESRITSFANVISKYFTFAIIVLAILAALLWKDNLTESFNAFTAVLIVACPCALALSSPFALGNTLRIFGRNKFYIKNTHIVEELAAIDAIVFDKTGTITENGAAEVHFIGRALSSKEEGMIKTVVNNSTHPLSIAINKIINVPLLKGLSSYSEKSGHGIFTVVDDVKVKAGSNSFVGVAQEDSDGTASTKVYISFDDEFAGYYLIKNKYRSNLHDIIKELEGKYDLSLLSGDNQGEKETLRKIFSKDEELHFNQSPQAKLDYVKELQLKGKKVLMIGDGLNDAGALAQSDVGISISDDVNNFSPACDGILDSRSFLLIKDFLAFSKTSKNIIVASFILSLVYNVIGLSIAFQGALSPLIAAILMPISSITAVIFTTTATNIMAKKIGLL